MKMLPRCLQFEGYETRDFRGYLVDGHIDVVLNRKDSKSTHCSRCQFELANLQQGCFMKLEIFRIGWLVGVRDKDWGWLQV